ncbi:MAG: hypothetical protein N3G22_03870 [Candidatus Micrarchaeota archaeon]|nr:hypothetical protein [Candidatus Micrarchaeota archaeon]
MKKWEALLVFLALQPVLFGAILQGTVYDSETLEEAEWAIVKINTIPEQTKVAKGGEYSFFVPAGNYTITAYSAGGERVAAENVEIEGDGNFTLDLLLFPKEGLSVPAVEKEEEIGGELSEEIEIGGAGSGKAESERGFVDAARSIALIVIFGLIVLYVLKKRKFTGKGREEKGGAPRPIRTLVVEPEQREAIEIIEKSGGAITQKELRKKLPYSEAKVSLLLTELEQEGIVKRFKRGRGNIIKLLKK